eukprot:69787_1
MSSKSALNSNNDETPARKRYVARVKNVCMAIPFNPNETLLSFQKEAILRASSHRKLKKENKLSNRIQFIKLATPHFPQLVDCYGKDMLCEIAGEEDILVFQTASDDEKEDHMYLTNTSSVSNHRNVAVLSNAKPPKSSATKRKKKERPHTAKNTSNGRWSGAKGSNTPTPSSTLKYKPKQDSKTKRRSLGVIDSSNASKSDSKSRKKSNKLNNPMKEMQHSKSAAALHDEKSDDDEANDGSDRSGYNSGHSGHSSGDEEIKMESLSTRKTKRRKSKKKAGSTHDMSAFAAEVMSAKKSTKKRDFEEDEA